MTIIYLNEILRETIEWRNLLNSVYERYIGFLLADCLFLIGFQKGGSFTF